jgi:AmiR/NasT family two-component response regulator
VLAEAAFAAVLAEVAGHDPDDLAWISDIHAEVHQACGMVMYQLKITIEAALLRLRAHAYAHDLPIGVVARQIVSHQLSLGTEQ